MIKLKTFLIISLQVALGVFVCSGAITISLNQASGNLVFSGSGTLNISSFSSTTTPDSFNTYSGIGSAFPAFRLGGPGPTTVNGYFDVFTSTPGAMGDSDVFTRADFGSGDVFGIGGINGNALIVPEGYISGNALEGSITYVGESLDSLGLQPGVYTWHFGEGAEVDSFTIIIPEPTSTALIFCGSCFMVLFMKRKRLGIATARCR